MAAAVLATVVLASPPVDDDETLRRKNGLVNDPVVPRKCKQECTIRRPVDLFDQDTLCTTQIVRKGTQCSTPKTLVRNLVVGTFYDPINREGLEEVG